MAPSANRLTPPAVRALMTASLSFQQEVKKAVLAIQAAIEQGVNVEHELAFAQLLLALAETERALTWVAERSRILLGEQTEPKT